MEMVVAQLVKLRQVTLVKEEELILVLLSVEMDTNQEQSNVMMATL